MNIEPFISKCQATRWPGRVTFDATRKCLDAIHKSLTAEEEDLLITALEGKPQHEGEFCLHEGNQTTFIQAGHLRFVRQGHPAYADRYLESFQALCERGFVKYESGQLFVLTSSGLRRAHQLSVGFQQEVRHYQQSHCADPVQC